MIALVDSIVHEIDSEIVPCIDFFLGKNGTCLLRICSNCTDHNSLSGVVVQKILYERKLANFVVCVPNGCPFWIVEEAGTEVFRPGESVFIAGILKRFHIFFYLFVHLIHEKIRSDTIRESFVGERSGILESIFTGWAVIIRDRIWIAVFSCFNTCVNTSDCLITRKSEFCKVRTSGSLSDGCRKKENTDEKCDYSQYSSDVPVQEIFGQFIVHHFPD